MKMTNDEILQQTKHLIGTRYTESVKAYITELTGRNRVHGPGEVITREFDVNRVGVVADNDGIITAISFG
jgi:hypothetical protein